MTFPGVCIDRLKLEEDTRRKLETERERSERDRSERDRSERDRSERDRSERDRSERDRSDREQRSERSREPTSHAVAPSVRERSPMRPADPGAASSVKTEPRTTGENWKRLAGRALGRMSWPSTAGRERRKSEYKWGQRGVPKEAKGDFRLINCGVANQKLLRTM